VRVAGIPVAADDVVYGFSPVLAARFPAVIDFAGCRM
jgi:hypothetical protein